MLDPKAIAETHPKPSQMDLYSSAKHSSENLVIALGRGGKEERGLGEGVKTMANLLGQSNAIATLPGDCVIIRVLKFNLRSCHGTQLYNVCFISRFLILGAILS